MCRPVITNSNLSLPGVPKMAMLFCSPKPPASSSSCLSIRACHSGLMMPFEDAADDLLLVLGVELVVVDEVFGDVPIVRDARSQQPALFVLMIPSEADVLTLLGRERVEQTPSPAFQAGWPSS